MYQHFQLHGPPKFTQIGIENTPSGNPVFVKGKISRFQPYVGLKYLLRWFKLQLSLSILLSTWGQFHEYELQRQRCKKLHHNKQ
jgi:hypothetical protein